MPIALTPRLSSIDCIRNAQGQCVRLLQVLRLSVSDTILCIILHSKSRLSGRRTELPAVVNSSLSSIFGCQEQAQVGTGMNNHQAYFSREELDILGKST